jgi:cytochrome c553
MLPLPTHLPAFLHDWSDEELFWIVKNGIKYTGMPAWVAYGRDDEVWAVVAFLRRLPAMQPQQYRSLARGNAGQRARDARELADLGADAAAISACARCHDDEAASSQSHLVPRLAGQSAEYLRMALQDYASGLRQSGIMQPVAAELDGEELLRLSSYYAALPTASLPHDDSLLDRIERGRVMATVGATPNGIPPCLACHGAQARSSYPRLAGQYREYLVRQLLLLKKGLRNQTPQGAIMTTIAGRLSDSQIKDVAEFFQQLEPGDNEASLGLEE